MPFKVLVYSRFPKAMMVRIGECFELMHAAVCPPRANRRLKSSRPKSYPASRQ
jgi:hypothetical protein